MDRVVASPALPLLGLEPRYLRQRRMPPDLAEQIETPKPTPNLLAGPGVDEATDALRQRIVAAKPLTTSRLLAVLRLSAP